MDTLTKSQRMRAYAKKAKRMAGLCEKWTCRHEKDAWIGLDTGHKNYLGMVWAFHCRECGRHRTLMHPMDLDNRAGLVERIVSRTIKAGCSRDRTLDLFGEFIGSPVFHMSELEKPKFWGYWPGIE